MNIKEASKHLQGCKSEMYTTADEITAYEQKFEVQLPNEIKWFAMNIGELERFNKYDEDNSARHLSLVLDDMKAIATFEELLLDKFVGLSLMGYGYAHLEEGLIPIGQMSTAEFGSGGFSVLAMSKREQDFGTIWLTFRAQINALNALTKPHERSRSSIKLADNLTELLYKLQPDYEDIEENLEALQAQTVTKLTAEYEAIQEEPTQTKTAKELVDMLIAGEEIIYNKARNVAFRYLESSSGSQVCSLDDMKGMAQFMVEYSQPKIGGTIRKKAKTGKIIAMDKEYGIWFHDPNYLFVEIKSEIESLKNTETFILYNNNGLYSLVRRWKHEAKGYRVNGIGTFMLENGSWETQKRRKYPMFNAKIAISAVDVSKSELDKELITAKKNLNNAVLEEKILKLIYQRYITIEYFDFEQMSAEDKEDLAQCYPEVNHWKDAYALLSSNEGNYTISSCNEGHILWLPYLPDEEHGITLVIEHNEVRLEP